MPTSAPDSDLYLTTTYQDPLLFSEYIQTNDPHSIDLQVHDDLLLSGYMDKLNQEIIDDIPEFQKHKLLINDIFWNCRTHGWCVVQFYKNRDGRVFSSLQWTKWITEIDEFTKKNIREGVEVTWTDDIENDFSDRLYFDDRINENNDIEGKAYLFIWKKGNGRILEHSTQLSNFALADTHTGILSLAIQIRQITSGITFGATNPFFYFLKYGNSITPSQRSDLVEQMSYVGTSRAVGAKGQTLEEITAIENGSVAKCIEALHMEIALFASVTRLPLSYYLGEKQTGGLGDTGASTDELKVMKKKEFILQHFITGLEEIFADQFEETLPDLMNFYTNQIEEKQKQKEILSQSQDLQNKEETETNVKDPNPKKEKKKRFRFGRK